MTVLASTSCIVDCAGEQHRLVWQDGALTAADHPDPERERTLAALGGQAHRCLQLLDLWQRHAEDLDVLLLATRGPQDIPARAHDAPGHPGHVSYRRRGSVVYASSAGSSKAGWYAYSPLSQHEQQPAPGLADLLRLGGGLPQRLAAQVIESWVGRLQAGDPAADAVLPRLHAALYGRFAAVVRGWLADSELSIELHLDEPARLERSGDAVRVALPFSWLTEVWLPGLALVADRLCLSAVPDDAGWTLETVDRGLSGSVTVQVRVLDGN